MDILGEYSAGWWWMIAMNLAFSHYYWVAVIIPIDSYFSEGLKPPTRYTGWIFRIYWVYPYWVNIRIFPLLSHSNIGIFVGWIHRYILEYWVYTHLILFHMYIYISRMDTSMDIPMIYTSIYIHIGWISIYPNVGVGYPIHHYHGHTTWCWWIWRFPARHGANPRARWMVYNGSSHLQMDDDLGVALWLRKLPYIIGCKTMIEWTNVNNICILYIYIYTYSHYICIYIYIWII